MLRKAISVSDLATACTLLSATAAPAQSPLRSGSALGPGKPLRQAFMTASPAEVEFGAVDVDGNGSRQTIRLENTFPKAVAEKIRPLAVAGKQSSAFTIENDGCSGTTLQRAPESCTVEVVFAPGAPIESAATLTFVAEEAEAEEGEEEVLEEIEVPLSGEGVIGTLSANPSPLSFSPIPYAGSGAGEGEQNETQQVTILDSTAATDVKNVSIVGEDASSFSIQYGDCEHDLLSANATCDMGIRFEALSPGVKHAQLQITSDSPGGPLEVPLDGEGLHGPQMILSTTQALLGDVLVGSSSTQTFTVTNVGDYPLGIAEAVLISGTPQTFPVLSDTCSEKSIKPGATCAVTVAFSPTTAGEKDASILFITGGSTPLRIVGVDGVGVQPSAVSPASAPLPAGAPPAPWPSASLALTLTNPQAPQDVPATAGTAPTMAPSATQSPSLLQRGAAHTLGAGMRTLDTGFDAACPGQSGGCEVTSLVITNLRVSRPGVRSDASSGVTVLLGSQTARLPGGARARLQVSLSARAASLLRRRGRLRATMAFVLRGGGQIVATRTRAVTLVS